MPNNNAKLRFNGAYCNRIDRYVQSTQNIYRSIQRKLRGGKTGDLNRAVSALWVIKQFAYVNIGKVPISDAHSIMKYDMVSLQKIRNAKESHKVLFNTLEEKAQSQHKALYSNAHEVFNQIEAHLQEMIEAGNVS